MGKNDDRGRRRQLRAAASWFHLSSDPRILAKHSTDILEAMLQKGLSIQSEIEHANGPEQRAIELGIHAIRSELATRGIASSATENDAAAKKIVLPPRLLYDGLLRRFMPPSTYERYITPHVADMHEEYFAALSKADQSGARWAVIRGHLYVVPSWVWAQVGRLLARVLGKRI